MKKKKKEEKLKAAQAEAKPEFESDVKKADVEQKDTSLETLTNPDQAIPMIEPSAEVITSIINENTPE